MTVCDSCGKEVVGKRSDAKYCSVICGNRSRNRKYYKANPDVTKKNRDLQNSRVEKRILSRVKSRAKRNKIPFDLDASDIVVPKVCPVLGLELVLFNQGSGYHPDSPSLDRINPKLGYVKGNVRVISARANLLKNDATAEELKKVLVDLERIEDEKASLGHGNGWPSRRTD